MRLPDMARVSMSISMHGAVGLTVTLNEVNGEPQDRRDSDLHVSGGN